MDKLLSPDLGLVIWTVLSFLILVSLLRVFAWGPLLKSIDEREARLRDERERAEKARSESERIQKELEARLSGAAEEAKSLVSRAGKDAEALRARLKSDAESEAKALVDKTRAQLEDEKNRLVGELRREVAVLSVSAAERLIAKSVDAGVQKSVLEGFFAEIDKEKARN